MGIRARKAYSPSTLAATAAAMGVVVVVVVVVVVILGYMAVWVSL